MNDNKKPRHLQDDTAKLWFEMKKSIIDIAPWLSASLSPMNGGSHTTCKEYEDACNTILGLAANLSDEKTK